MWVGLSSGHWLWQYLSREQLRTTGPWPLTTFALTHEVPPGYKGTIGTRATGSPPSTLKEGRWDKTRRLIPRRRRVRPGPETEVTGERRPWPPRQGQQDLTVTVYTHCTGKPWPTQHTFRVCHVLSLTWSVIFFNVLMIFLTLSRHFFGWFSLGHTHPCHGFELFPHPPLCVSQWVVYLF